MNKFYSHVVWLFLLLSFLTKEETGIVFSSDQTVFFQEMHNFFQTKNDKEAGILITALQTKTNAGHLGEKGFLEMVMICNQMAKLKMKPKPYYLDYLGGLDKIESNDIGNWHNSVTKLLKTTKQGKFKPYSQFLNFSLHFFESRYLKYSKSGISWKMENVDFQMKWKDNQPILDFEKSSLTAERKAHKLKIINASGTFFPLENKWKGRGGKVTWKRLDKDSEISANLLDYEIDLTKNTYSAEKAFLIYPQYFDNKTIEGKFQDKLVIGNRSKGGSFPRFESKSGDLNLKNIAPGVDFTGGIKISGLTITGYNPEEKNAILDYQPTESAYQTRLSAASFSIKKSGEIVVNEAKTSMFFGKDSLYHPSANVRLIPGKKMTLQSGEKSATKAPFFDSRQEVYFYAKKIEWDIEKNKMLINPGGGNRSVEFESEHFYDKNYVHRIQNSANHQPIVLLYLMSQEDGRVIDANYFAKKLNSNFTIDNIRNLLFDLERHGFFRYLTDSQELMLTDKVAHYAESHGARKDFDIIKIQSNHGETNAIYDLEKEEMNINGVERVVLQNRQKVAFKPTKEELVLKKNRQIAFDGKIYSGLINIAGKGCLFDYEKFIVKVDSLEFFDIYLPADSTNEFEDNRAYGIGSRIEKSSGYLLVNAPDNKSGKEKLEEYPAFQSEAPSYVYYDEENKQGECYKKETFFFELDPFKLQNLAKPKPGDLVFDGQLVSGGIFPAFKETLVLKKDKSLGFSSDTPSAGYPIFNEKGNFKGNIDLSNQGLEGKGNLTYSGTQVDSEDLIFKPDRVTGSADYFHLEEDEANSVPEVKGYDVTIDWKPYEDSMTVESKDKSFQLFNEGEHEIGGVLISTPTGLKGRGIFQWGEGEMGANLFNFGAHQVQSEKTDLKIKSLDNEALAFDTKDLKGSIDFQTQKGQFKSNDATSITKMPANFFQTTLNEFEWDLGKKALTFVGKAGKKGTFTSTHSDQDSLNFDGSTANFDFETGLLKIDGVEKIEVADAFIIPNKGVVEVETGGYLRKFENAEILANRTNRYHKFTNATISVLGKNTYDARGFYEYKVGDFVQSIEFKNITGRKRGKGKMSEKVSTTEAHKTIAETDGFRLDPKTFFYGSIDLEAANPYLQFTGYAKLDAPLLAKAHWFKVDFQGDINKFLIAADKPKSPENWTLHTGIYMNKETRSNYTNVLMPLQEEKDRCLFDANGVFRFDGLNQYIFGNKEKMEDDFAPGNRLCFSQKNAEITAKGSFNICPNIQGAKVQLAGVAKTGFAPKHLKDPALANQNLSGDFAAKLDFKLPKPLMEMIEKDFFHYRDSVEKVTYSNQEVYQTAIKEWIINHNQKIKALSEININGNFKIKEKKKPASFILGQLPMKWHSAKQSFICTTDSIALASINGEEYNKKVAALVVFTTPANEDDRVYVMLRTPGNKYYYLNYKKGILHVQSNNPDFNDKVESMKTKDLTVKLKNGESYEVQLTTSDVVGNFRRNVQDWKKEVSSW